MGANVVKVFAFRVVTTGTKAVGTMLLSATFTMWLEVHATCMRKKGFYSCRNRWWALYN